METQLISNEETMANGQTLFQGDYAAFKIAISVSNGTAVVRVFEKLTLLGSAGYLPANTILFSARLLDACHILAAAHSNGAAFDPNGAGVEFEEMAFVIPAVIDVIQSTGPFARAIRYQRV
jgi:hypothetical protein